MTKIAILIAARNEANNILDCLRSVDALSYPKEHIQVLIGNDDSEDETAALVSKYIENKPHFTLVSIVQPADCLNRPGGHVSGSSKRQTASISERYKLKGKTNVLAQLAQLAQAEYLFFTDADIEVPINWIQNMLVHFKPNVGVVTGITTMKPHPLSLSTKGENFWRFCLESFQGLEWLYYLSLMRLFSLFNVPVTAMGNNMAVSRTAYDRVGGYENIPFSITEDYELFHAILKEGFRFVQLFDRRVLTISKPIPTYRELLIQRKRWMFGAISLPWEQRIGIYLNAFLLPFLGMLIFFFPKITLLIIFAMYISVTAWLVGVLNWLQYSKFFIVLPFFWFYHVFTNFAMLVNFYLRKETRWKGRNY